MTGVLTGSSKGWAMREVQIMVSVITCLSGYLPSSSAQVCVLLDRNSVVVTVLCVCLQFEQVCGWTLAQCREQNIGEYSKIHLQYIAC